MDNIIGINAIKLGKGANRVFFVGCGWHKKWLLNGMRKEASRLTQPPDRSLPTGSLPVGRGGG